MTTTTANKNLQHQHSTNGDTAAPMGLGMSQHSNQFVNSYAWPIMHVYEQLKVSSDRGSDWYSCGDCDYGDSMRLDRVQQKIKEAMFAR